MNNIFYNVFKCVAGCLALIGGVASAMGLAGGVWFIFLLGILDLIAVMFLTWYKPALETDRHGMVIIQSILWFIGFILILLI